MLEQHLDKGGEWVEIDEFTVEDDLINYEYSIELAQRADAILVYVTLPGFESTWERAGYLAQYWDTNDETYQTAFDKVRLQDKQVIGIAPLEVSRLVFRPVEWLRGWTILIRARLCPLSNRDILEQVAANQEAVTDSSGGGIKTPCLLKSLHAPCKSNTVDTIVMEVHHKIGQGVQERFFLQYYGKNEMPVAYPEFILFPENVIFVIPDQDSTIHLVLEPIDLLAHGTIKI